MPHTITFLPSNKTGLVASGIRISDAATTIDEFDLHLECGGKGTCQKCLVELVAGCVEINDRIFTVAKGAKPLRILSCQGRVCGDGVFSIVAGRAHEAATMSLGKDIAAIPPGLLPAAQDISPIVTTLRLCVDQPGAERNFPDGQRLETQVWSVVKNDAPVAIELSALRSLPDALRDDNGRVTVRLRNDREAMTVLSVDAGDKKGPDVGIACDIGTTTVSVHCVDLSSGKVLASASDYNGQIRRGADVISRIDYAKNGQRIGEMRSLVLATMNGLIATVLDHVHIPAGEVFNVALAGNTTMIHLLLGLPSQAIRESPYVPVVNAPQVMRACDVGLDVHPLAAVSFAPGVGSYVGGDITSGLLTTPMIHDKHAMSLFMDIGTNGEIAIGNAEFLMAAACSAGPAFEGSGIKCGMRAALGAIESFETDAQMNDVRYSVIGGGKPKGVCGSGLISLLGELYTKGLIDRAGKISASAPARNIVKIDGTTGLVLAQAADTLDGAAIAITESDIDNLIRTKGAIYAACDLMLANIGLSVRDISHVYIAGGFGRFIDIDKAVRIGMLPDIPRDKFAYLGNSSLTGATLCLLSKARRKQLAALAKRITYIDLSSDHRYMDAYVAALFLPHTDASRFPSVT